MKCNSSIHLQPFKYGRGGKLPDRNTLKTNLLIRQRRRFKDAVVFDWVYHTAESPELCLSAPAIPEWGERRRSLRRWRRVRAGIAIGVPGRIMSGSPRIGRLLRRRL